MDSNGGYDQYGNYNGFVMPGAKDYDRHGQEIRKVNYGMNSQGFGNSQNAGGGDGALILFIIILIISIIPYAIAHAISTIFLLGVIRLFGYKVKYKQLYASSLVSFLVFNMAILGSLYLLSMPFFKDWYGKEGYAILIAVSVFMLLFSWLIASRVFLAALNWKVKTYKFSTAALFSFLNIVVNFILCLVLYFIFLSVFLQKYNLSPVDFIKRLFS